MLLDDMLADLSTGQWALASAIAGALLSVALFFYLPAVSRFFRLYWRWTKDGLPTAPPRELKRALDWLVYPIDVFDSKAGWRTYLGFWLALVLLVIFPVAIAGLTLALAIHLAR